MVEQFGDGVPLLGVFGEAAQNEVLNALRGQHAAREVDLLLDHLRQILLRPYFEGHSPVKQFVGEHPDVPDVDLVVVLLLLDYFGGGVEGGAAEGVAEEGGVDGPAEVADFDDVLRGRGSTSWKRMF